jgi:hypothetical protein
MRTKTLFIAAAVLAAGIGSSVAQTVYSANIVGYVNATVPAGGFALIANPLDATPDNTLGTIITNVPVNTTIAFLFNPQTASYIQTTYRASGWSGGAGTTVMDPGAGFFLENTATTPITITFVGEVEQGTVTSFSTGYNLIGNVTPVSGLVQTDLGLPAVNGDVIYQFNPVTKTYAQFTRRATAWGGGLEPTIGTNSLYGVCEAFFYDATAAGTWTNTFTAQ